MHFTDKSSGILNQGRTKLEQTHLELILNSAEINKQCSAEATGTIISQLSIMNHTCLDTFH